MLTTVQEQLQQALEEQAADHPIAKQLKDPRGLRIYIDGYFARLASAVEDDFEITTRIINDFSTIEKFVKNGFAKHYSLFDYTKDFPESLEEPFLKDLALFELCLKQSALKSHRSEKTNPSICLQQGINLRLCSSVILFKSEFPVDKIYEDEKYHDKEPCSIVVWNSEFSSYYKKISLIEYRLFNAFLTHNSMDEIFEDFTFEELQEHLQGFIAEWTAKSVFL